MKHVGDKLGVKKQQAGHKVIEWAAKQQAWQAFGKKQTLCQTVTFESWDCLCFGWE